MLKSELARDKMIEQMENRHKEEPPKAKMPQYEENSYGARVVSPSIRNDAELIKDVEINDDDSPAVAARKRMLARQQNGHKW